MTGLAQLPSEILGLAFSNSSYSFLIFKLWKTGNKLLTSKLRLCMTHLSLTCLKNNLPQLPPVLFELKNLRFLSLECEQELLRDPTGWPAEIKKLPETLETLSIATTDAHLSLLNYVPGCTVDAMDFVQTRYTLGSSRLIDLERLFPALHTLKLDSQIGFCNLGDSSLSSSDFAGLPSTLTSLNVNTRISSFKAHEGPAQLPRSLRFLFGRVACSGPETSLANWPPELEHIDWSERFTETLEDTKWLPRTLKHLGNGRFMSWSPTMSQNLPPLLETLTIDAHRAYQAMGENWASELPRTLKTLSLMETLPSDMAAFSIKDLPPLLTRLDSEMRSKGWGHVKAQMESAGSEGNSLWPRSLTDLQFRQLGIPAHELRYLPSTLKSLKITVTEDKRQNSAVEMNVLFPDLERLTLFGGDLYLKNHLPTKLRVLRLELNPGNGDDLAESHTKLSPSPLDYPSTLPPSLESLYVSFFHCDLFATLPRTIRSFTAEQTSGYKDSRIVAEGRIFEQLPPHLVQLRIGGSWTDSWDEVIPVLDCTSVLRYLSEFLFEMTLPSHFIRYLPRELSKLTVTLKSLEPEDAPFICALVSWHRKSKPITDIWRPTGASRGRRVSVFRRVLSVDFVDVSDPTSEM